MNDARSTNPLELTIASGLVLNQSFMKLPAGAGPMLNPRGRTLVGTVSRGQTLRFVLRGRWSPWSPTESNLNVKMFDCAGDSGEMFHGANKWCVAICISDPNTSERSFHAVAVSGGQKISVVGPFAVNDIWLYMNDDSHGDNTADPSDPMKFEPA